MSNDKTTTIFVAGDHRLLVTDFGNGDVVVSSHHPGGVVLSLHVTTTEADQFTKHLLDTDLWKVDQCDAANQLATVVPQDVAEQIAELREEASWSYTHSMVAALYTRIADMLEGQANEIARHRDGVPRVNDALTQKNLAIAALRADVEQCVKEHERWVRNSKAAISKAEAEVARLWGERDEAVAAAKTREAEWLSRGEKVNALHAKVERLRGWADDALSLISELWEGHAVKGLPYAERWNFERRIKDTHAALRGEGGEDE